MYTLITGATGFLGSRVLHHLIEHGEKNLIALHREQSQLHTLAESCITWLYTGSIYEISELFSTYEIRDVIHIAAHTCYDVELDTVDTLISSNLQLGIHLLEVMRRHNCTNFINTSTYWQHLDGDARFNPVCLYAAMKHAFEEICTLYLEREEIKLITLELTDVYGPNDPRQKLFKLLKNYSETNQTLKMSSGTQHINLLHVQDATSAYLHALRLIRDEQFQVGSANRYSVHGPATKTLKDIIGIFQAANQGKPSVEFGGRPDRSREVRNPFIGTSVPNWAPIRHFQDEVNELIMETSHAPT